LQQESEAIFTDWCKSTNGSGKGLRRPLKTTRKIACVATTICLGRPDEVMLGNM
jgi:hypothetical protein